MPATQENIPIRGSLVLEIIFVILHLYYSFINFKISISMAMCVFVSVCLFKNSKNVKIKIQEARNKLNFPLCTFQFFFYNQYLTFIIKIIIYQETIDLLVNVLKIRFTEPESQTEMKGFCRFRKDICRSFV